MNLDDEKIMAHAFKVSFDCNKKSKDLLDEWLQSGWETHKIPTEKTVIGDSFTDQEKNSST